MNFSLGDLVYITFLDHTRHLGDASPGVLELNAMGRVVANEEKFVTISFWHYGNNDRDENCEEFSIVKSAIVNVRKL